MVYIVAALAVWWIWYLLLKWVTAPDWAWDVFVTALGVGAQLLIDPAEPWWGVGIAGLAVVVKRTEDLLLVTGDSVRVGVIRTTRR